MMKMGSDEKFPGVIMPSSNAQVGVGNNRRALSVINRNIIGAPPYPCAVHKRGVLTEKNEAGGKNCVGPVHRAAQGSMLLDWLEKHCIPLTSDPASLYVPVTARCR
ncbi:cyclin-B2-4-like [Salvia splendens]|uniref:cyclin-B2-4-like n=1 Tax=Salvia splendens TaxID=180675 RepID=UPI001C25C12B|nr:cyclin-B2-4-like [Salvia splendens]